MKWVINKFSFMGQGFHKVLRYITHLTNYSFTGESTIEKSLEDLNRMLNQHLNYFRKFCLFFETIWLIKNVQCKKNK